MLIELVLIILKVQRLFHKISIYYYELIIYICIYIWQFNAIFITTLLLCNILSNAFYFNEMIDELHKDIYQYYI